LIVCERGGGRDRILSLLEGGDSVGHINSKVEGEGKDDEEDELKETQDLPSCPKSFSLRLINNPTAPENRG